MSSTLRIIEKSQSPSFRDSMFLESTHNFFNVFPACLSAHFQSWILYEFHTKSNHQFVLFGLGICHGHWMAIKLQFITIQSTHQKWVSLFGFGKIVFLKVEHLINRTPKNGKDAHRRISYDGIVGFPVTFVTTSVCFKIMQNPFHQVFQIIGFVAWIIAMLSTVNIFSCNPCVWLALFGFGIFFEGRTLRKPNIRTNGKTRTYTYIGRVGSPSTSVTNSLERSLDELCCQKINSY